MIAATKLDITQLMAMVEDASVKEGTFFDAYGYVLECSFQIKISMKYFSSLAKTTRWLVNMEGL